MKRAAVSALKVTLGACLAKVKATEEALRGRRLLTFDEEGQAQIVLRAR